MSRVALLALAVGCAPPDPPSEASPFGVITFNTGTSTGLAHDADPDDGYTSETAAFTDAHYGNGLSWEPAIAAARAFLDAAAPAVVGLQEVFWTGDCPEVPPGPSDALTCATWGEGDPTVARRLLPDRYAIACHPGFPDKCLAIDTAWGVPEACPEGLCLDALRGDAVPGCGSAGPRGAWTDVALVTGGTVRVANLHASSGVTPDDQACRVQQLDALFDALGDGPVIVVGDFNTDPGRFTFDPSAARVNALVDEGGFTFLTEVGPDAPRSYQGLATIDHVLARGFTGGCVTPGVTDGAPPVHDAVYFDHAPAVCSVLPEP